MRPSVFSLVFSCSRSSVPLFSLAMLPFSLKLLWAPYVDGKWIPSLGRRKTWIMPCQILGGLGMIVISFFADQMLDASSVYLGPFFFFLVLAFATQDIAVDGWALEILSVENLSYASTAQSVGQNIGYFSSFTVFLGAQSFGWITLNQFLWWWGWVFLICSAYLLFFKKEAPPGSSTQPPETVTSIYKQLWSVVKLPDFQNFAIFLLTYRVGLQANDRALSLRLIEVGFSKELLATFGFIAFPLGIIFAVYTGRLARGGTPLSGPFFFGMVLRHVTAMGAQVLLWVNGEQAPGASMIVALFALFAVSSLGGTLAFVASCAYFNVISPKSMGGTYLTFINTVANLGGTWPGVPVMTLIDYFGFSVVNVASLIGGLAYLVLRLPYLRSIEDVQRMRFSEPEGMKI